MQLYITQLETSTGHYLHVQSSYYRNPNFTTILPSLELFYKALYKSRVVLEQGIPLSMGDYS